MKYNKDDVVTNITKLLTEKDRGNQSIIANIEDQKQRHRTAIVVFAFCIGGFGTLLFGSIVISQLIMRVTTPEYTVLDGHQLEFLGTAILLQAFGIILFITRSLWSHRNSNQSALEKDFDDKRKR